MKYLMISEGNAEDWEAALKWDSEISADREKNPEKYPKRIVASLVPIGEWPRLSPDSIKSIGIVEGDEEQIENYIAHWMSARVSDVPSIRRWYVPLLEGPKVVAKMKR